MKSSNPAIKYLKLLKGLNPNFKDVIFIFKKYPPLQVLFFLDIYFCDHQKNSNVQVLNFTIHQNLWVLRVLGFFAQNIFKIAKIKTPVKIDVFKVLQFLGKIDRRFEPKSQCNECSFNFFSSLWIYYFVLEIFPRTIANTVIFFNKLKYMHRCLHNFLLWQVAARRCYLLLITLIPLYAVFTYWFIAFIVKKSDVQWWLKAITGYAREIEVNSFFRWNRRWLSIVPACPRYHQKLYITSVEPFPLYTCNYHLSAGIFCLKRNPRHLLYVPLYLSDGGLPKIQKHWTTLKNKV